MSNEWPKPRSRETTQPIAEAIAKGHLDNLERTKQEDTVAWAKELGKTIAYIDWLKQAPHDDFSEQIWDILTQYAGLEIQDETLWTHLWESYNIEADRLKSLDQLD